jgi:hypothetical protein
LILRVAGLDDVTALLIETLPPCFISGISMTQIVKGRFDGSKAPHRNRTAPPQSRRDRYSGDAWGPRVLIGLTAAETREFEALDALSPSDGEEIGWTFGGEPTTLRERRWLELYSRHNEAWRTLNGGDGSAAARHPRLRLTPQPLPDTPPGKR